MVSSYEGLYVIRSESGNIDSVQVRDHGGNSLPLTPDDYVARGIKPPIEQLPDFGQYTK